MRERDGERRREVERGLKQRKNKQNEAETEKQNRNKGGGGGGVELRKENKTLLV